MIAKALIAAGLVALIACAAARAEDAPARPSQRGAVEAQLLKAQRNNALDAVAGCYGEAQVLQERLEVAEGRAAAAETRAAALQKRVEELEVPAK